MNAESTIARDDAGMTESEPPKAPRSRSLRTVLMIAGPLVVIVVAGWFWLTGGRYESTDNASVQSAMVAISPSISGRVVAVEVSENQRVAKGDVLFRIKPASFEAAVAEAEAELAGARSDVTALRADYREALSEIGAAKARYRFAVSEAARQKSLVGEGISSRAQFDEANTAVQTAREGIAAAEAKAESLRADLGGATSGGVDGQPAVRRAISKLEQARLDLGDTIVRAPQDGIVTKVNQLQVGNVVTAGRPVFMMTGLTYWVQANFKENQLRYMRGGQPVAIEIDAFPDHTLKGHVESFSPGTGSSFSVLPAENATGNWVKVVQRLPVQIAIDTVPAGLPLSSGLSATVEVDTGRERHLFGGDTVAAAAVPAK